MRSSLKKGELDINYGHGEASKLWRGFILVWLVVIGLVGLVFAGQVAIPIIQDIKAKSALELRCVLNYSVKASCSN